MSIAAHRLPSVPPITIADTDLDRLEALALAGEFAGHPVADFLAAELARAVVRPADELGPDVVRMNCRVAFQIGSRRAVEIRTLVYPHEYSWWQAGSADRVSIMTPLGAALLGLRAGASMSYESDSGVTQRVTVVGVLPPSMAASVARDHREWAAAPRDDRRARGDGDAA